MPSRITSVMIHYGATGERITVGQKYLGEEVLIIRQTKADNYPIVTIITEGREHQVVGFPHIVTREEIKV